MAGLEQITRNKVCRTKINNNINKKHKLKTMSVWPVAVHSTILLCHFHAQVASLSKQNKKTKNKQMFGVVNQFSYVGHY